CLYVLSQGAAARFRKNIRQVSNGKEDRSGNFLPDCSATSPWDGSDSCRRRGRVEVGTVAQRREQDVATPPCQDDQDLVATYARHVCPIRPRQRVLQRRERGQKQSPFENLVTPPGRMVPRTDVSDRHVTGYRPAETARCPVDSKSLPTCAVRIHAAVLTPAAGIDVRSSKDGCA